MSPLFSSGGGHRGRPWGRRREAGRRWWFACFALVREEEEDGRLGREGGLGRPRG
jgi:hypothetical protein